MEQQPMQTYNLSQPEKQDRPQSPPAQYPPPRAKGQGCFGFFAMLFVMIFIAMFFIGMMASVGGIDLTGISSGKTKLRTEHFMHNKDAKDKIAVIRIEGVIYESSTGFIKRQIEAVVDDPNVKGVVLRVNSPGGTVSGSDYYLHHLQEMKIHHEDADGKEKELPIVVSMGPVAASGGYYVSMCGDRIFAEPAGVTGSIGVIMQMYNGHELFGKIGLEEVDITSHRLKGMGSFGRPITEEEEAIWQDIVNQMFSMFTDVVKEGRPQFAEDPDKLTEIATGQVYTAKQAVENGLIDEVGFIEDAIDWLIAEAGLDKEKVNVIRYKHEPTVSEILFGVKSNSQSMDIEETVSDLTTPQAYYVVPNMVPMHPDED